MFDDESVCIADDYDSSPSQKRGGPQFVHHVGKFGVGVEFRNGEVRVVRACKSVDEYVAPPALQECVLTVQDEQRSPNAMNGVGSLDGPVRRMRDAKPPANFPRAATARVSRLYKGEPRALFTRGSQTLSPAAARGENMNGCGLHLLLAIPQPEDNHADQDYQQG